MESTELKRSLLTKDRRPALKLHKNDNCRNPRLRGEVTSTSPSVKYTQ